MIMRLTTILLITLIFGSCKEEALPLPKPRIYPKVSYPDKKMAPMNLQDCPFSLEAPTYFQYLKDTAQNQKEKQFKCWFDLYCEALNGYVHISYIDFKGRPAFDELVQDAFEMVDKHNIKASHRQELTISKPEDNLYGLIFEIDGPVATPLQFYMTDSLQHFIRGSLYFKSSVNRDSIAPVYQFLREDIVHMIETFEWE